MKYKILGFILLLGAVVTGCVKTSQPTPPLNAPSGTFNGQFKRYHRHIDTAKFDSLTANLTIKFKTPSYTFAVTGDTTTLHAGSHGTFGLNSQYMIFNDSTFSLTSQKAHLNGTYLYNYDGTNLTIYATVGDTLVVGYVLKKATN